MERIHKLPFILGCLAAMAVGVTSYIAGAESRTIYLRMAVMMLAFYIIGVIIKNTVLDIEKEVQIKRQEQEKAEVQQLEQHRLEQQESASTLNNQTLYQGQSQGQQNYKLDLTARDTEDDFEPLAISKAIRSNVKE